MAAPKTHPHCLDELRDRTPGVVSFEISTLDHLIGAPDAQGEGILAFVLDECRAFPVGADTYYLCWLTAIGARH